MRRPSLEKGFRARAAKGSGEWRRRSSTITSLRRSSPEKGFADVRTRSSTITSLRRLSPEKGSADVRTRSSTVTSLRRLSPEKGFADVRTRSSTVTSLRRPTRKKVTRGTRRGFTGRKGPKKSPLLVVLSRFQAGSIDFLTAHHRFLGAHP